MSIIDDRTINLSIPLPNIGNSLADDVARLRDALIAIDSQFFKSAGYINFHKRNGVSKPMTSRLTKFVKRDGTIIDLPKV